MSKHWYTTSARNFACNQHPKQPTGLAAAVGEYTGISLGNAAHVLDRLLHLSTCLEEPEEITLLRLQQGKNQHPPKRDDEEDEYE